MRRPPAFSEALLRAKKAYNAQAMREGLTPVGEHDMEDAVWAVYELLLPHSARGGRSERQRKDDDSEHRPDHFPQGEEGQHDGHDEHEA
jgi:hypothetical protein